MLIIEYGAKKVAMGGSGFTSLPVPLILTTKFNSERHKMPLFASQNTQHLLKTTSISTLFPQNPCTIQINALPLQQHTYPASRKNSALRVSLFFYGHDITILQPAAYYG